MINNKRTKISFSRTLRKGQTKTEKILWHLLRGKRFSGFKFRRQHIISGFILDFYCPKAKLGIELDGEVHIRQKDYDAAREVIIKENGVKILRFCNSEIYREPEKALQAVIDNLPNSPLHRVERGDPDEIGVGEADV